MSHQATTSREVITDYSGKAQQIPSDKGGWAASTRNEDSAEFRHSMY